MKKKLHTPDCKHPLHPALPITTNTQKYTKCTMSVSNTHNKQCVTNTHKIHCPSLIHILFNEPCLRYASVTVSFFGCVLLLLSLSVSYNLFHLQFNVLLQFHPICLPRPLPQPRPLAARLFTASWTLQCLIK